MTSSFQLAGNSDILEKANKFFGDPNFQKLPASVQEAFAMVANGVITDAISVAALLKLQVWLQQPK